MRFQSGATWTIWCDLPLDLMGSGENLWLGQKFWVWVKILGRGIFLGLGEHFWCKVPIGSHGFKVQSTNLNLKFCTKKFGKNPNFWRQIQIAIWFGVRFNLTGEERRAGGHMNNKGTL